MWIPVSNIWIQTEILNSFWKFCYAILIYLLLYLYFLHFRFKIDIVQYGGLLLIRTLKKLRRKLLLLLLAFSRVNWGGDKLTTPGVKSKCVCVCGGDNFNFELTFNDNFSFLALWFLSWSHDEASLFDQATPGVLFYKIWIDRLTPRGWHSTK